MKITKTIAKKVLSIVDAGLCSGVGKPIPGQMCVEAAVCYALNEPHGDEPTCVSYVLRTFKIALNDAHWSSNQTRAKGLRRIAVAQLGTNSTLDEQEFIQKLSELTIKKLLSKTLRNLSQFYDAPYKFALLNSAQECEEKGTESAAWSAKSAATSTESAAKSAANSANFAAWSAEYAAKSAAKSANSAAWSAEYAAKSANSAAWSAKSANDQILIEFAEDVVQILIELQTPGSKYLNITEGKQS